MNQYNQIPEVCSGCYTHMMDPETRCCLHGKEDKCPCTACLIKGVCATPCDDFHNLCVEEGIDD
jgi:hypothetical protein